MPRGNRLQSLATYLYSGADAGDRSGFYRDAEYPGGPTNCAGVDPTRRHRGKSGARRRADPERCAPRRNRDRAERAARQAGRSRSLRPGPTDRSRHDRAIEMLERGGRETAAEPKGIEDSDRWLVGSRADNNWAFL